MHGAGAAGGRRPTVCARRPDPTAVSRPSLLEGRRPRRRAREDAPAIWWTSTSPPPGGLAADAPPPQATGTGTCPPASEDGEPAFLVRSRGNLVTFRLRFRQRRWSRLAFAHAGSGRNEHPRSHASLAVVRPGFGLPSLSPADSRGCRRRNLPRLSARRGLLHPDRRARVRPRRAAAAHRRTRARVSRPRTP